MGREERARKRDPESASLRRLAPGACSPPTHRTKDVEILEGVGTGRSRPTKRPMVGFSR
ncbi:hypothetical protein HanXRQr2_Chr07g0289541 [Helianthus annuus]|uniref:Uncharacterized protein n=1 Tax=Helianthus annuus TaxID=4232 RepID=A0A251T6W6_HELAN|nr:hypothetical protein HanXRQr2_Chr07g0289541 [Helianthus annuus]KAJ0549794.1 hypothetical protein HanHA300_Chr07g0238071 [Helianthus annuus]KAJ0556303.1 hypothetical protein HanIR_Chr07g0312281 [Helianthus annuus]KAJ0562748.1 hypothetical protein HanHA89_Chr07g0255231 [Helianthus annuus]KAJ0728122.1 hypothetical protein HanLR1_Chr07g0237991 [Helianthus annuus]